MKFVFLFIFLLSTMVSSAEENPWGTSGAASSGNPWANGATSSSGNPWGDGTPSKPNNSSATNEYDYDDCQGIVRADGVCIPPDGSHVEVNSPKPGDGLRSATLDRQGVFSKSPRGTLTHDPKTPLTAEGEVALCNQYAQYIFKCEDETVAAHDSCDIDKNGTASAFDMARSGIREFERQVDGNPAAGCAGLAGILKGANMAFTAYDSKCAIGATACTDVCKEAKEFYSLNQALLAQCGNGAHLKLFNDTNAACTKAGRKAAAVKADIESINKAAAAETACANAAGDAVGLLSASDCKNPEVFNLNPICYCDPAKGDPSRCAAYKAKLTGGGVGGGTGLNAPGAGADGIVGTNADQSLNLSSLDPGGLGPDGVPQGGPGAKNRANPNGGGFGPSGGGAGQPAGKPKGGGPAGSSFNTKVNGGYGVGGNPAAFGGGSRGVSGSGGAGYSGAGGGAGSGSKVDLRQFLPGGKLDASRGLAGISGPDGITGPHSDLFRKVNNRYRSVSPLMKP